MKKIIKRRRKLIPVPPVFKAKRFNKKLIFPTLVHYQYHYKGSPEHMWMDTFYNNPNQGYRIEGRRRMVAYNPLHTAYSINLFKDFYNKYSHKNRNPKRLYRYSLSYNNYKLKYWRFKGKLKFFLLTAPAIRRDRFRSIIHSANIYSSKLKVYSKKRLLPARKGVGPLKRILFFRKSLKRSKHVRFLSSYIRRRSKHRSTYFSVLNIWRALRSRGRGKWGRWLRGSFKRSAPFAYRLLLAQRKLITFLRKNRIPKKRRLAVVLNYSKNNYFVSLISARDGNFIKLFSSGALKHKTTRRRRDFNSLMECWVNMIRYLRSKRINRLTFVKFLNKKYLSRVTLYKASQLKQLARRLRKNRIRVRRWVNVVVRSHGHLPRAPKLKRK